MKKSPKWAPRFDERLRQSKNTKSVPLKRAQGLKLYHVYGEVERKEMEPTVFFNPSGYGVTLKERTFTVSVYQGAKWLKPKHVTLMRMQGKEVFEAGKRDNIWTDFDIESN